MLIYFYGLAGSDVNASKTFYPLSDEDRNVIENEVMALKQLQHLLLGSIS